MMTPIKFAQKYNLTVVTPGDGSREIKGAYCGDLLSWVMGRAKEDDAFVTVMANINTSRWRCWRTLPALSSAREPTLMR